jgi:hypothetical protein
MKLQRLLVVSLAAMLCASCSRSPDLQGTWKNADGNLLTFSADSMVLLGQEGLRGGDTGTYVLRDGVIHVVTRTQSDSLGSVHNEYFLLHRNDSLLLQRWALYRGSDYHEIALDDFAKRVGKSPERFAFTRSAK